MRRPMHYRVLTVAFVVFAVATPKSRAWNQPPVAYISNWQQFVAVDARVQLDGTGSYDPDGYIIDYTWTYPPQAYNIWGANGSRFACNFNSPGDYYVYLFVTDNEWADDMDYAHIYVFAADLTWDGSHYLPVNSDNNDVNLRAIHPDVTPDLYGGDARLSYTGDATIKVWQAYGGVLKYQLITLPYTWPVSRLPGTLYVEGMAPDTAENGSQLTVAYLRSGSTIHSDSVTFTVVNLAITSPTETARDVAFDGNSPGVCRFTVTGTTGIPALDANLEWTLAPAGSSTPSSLPDPPQGSSVTFTYTGLPASNGDFGEKTLTLKFKDGPATAGQTIGKVRLFFTPEAKNHPILGGEEAPDYNDTPNWFYYWRKGGVVDDLNRFIYKEGPDAGLYDDVNDVLMMCTGAFDSWQEEYTFENIYHTTVNSGEDGIADTAAWGNDIQRMTVGQSGEPHRVVIDPNTDGFLDGRTVIFFDDEPTQKVTQAYDANCDRLTDVALTVQHEMTHQSLRMDLTTEVPAEIPPTNDNDYVHDTLRENMGPNWLCNEITDTYAFYLFRPNYPSKWKCDNEFLAWMSYNTPAFLDQ
jgi:hypothetical protein